MAVKILAVPAGTIAYRAGLRAGDLLLSINGQEIIDVLDYRFFETEPSLCLGLQRDGESLEIKIRKSRYGSLGLEFSSYLMDEQRSCRNRCIFCFIDQLPKGMRESLYFKDDDARLSFLFGNYITLTNLDRREIDRIITMKISPVNVSVHTTNPELRVKMMGNRFAGEVLSVMRELADGGIRLNAQLVLCPGINDGEELSRSLLELSPLFPQLESVAVVPVGLTKHRDGLFPLEPYTKEGAGRVIDQVEAFSEEQLARQGRRMAFCADEFYLKAGRPLPKADRYEDFPQLENGVGMLSLLTEEFMDALERAEDTQTPRRVSLATGVAAAPFLREMLDAAGKKWHNLRYNIFPIQNEFFGPLITVAGLLTGGDLICQLTDQDLGDELLIPAAMLRQGEDIFLDDITPDELSERLRIPVRAVENDGQALLDAVLGVK